MPTPLTLTEAQVLVNLIREFLGKAPLYGREGFQKPAKKEPTGLYVLLEMRSQRADRDCKRCGGAGYYDGEDLGMVCPCTGLKPRAKRNQSTAPDAARWRKKSAHAPTT